MHDFSLTERKESKQARARELRTATPSPRFTADYAWRHPGLNLGDVATRGIEPSVAIALGRHHTRGIEIVTSTRPLNPERAAGRHPGLSCPYIGILPTFLHHAVRALFEP